VLLSIVIGAASHLFWDSFTHDNTLLTSAVPESADFIWLGSKVMPVWQVVALVSTVIGALIIGYVVWKMPVSGAGTVPDTSAVLNYWSMIAFIAACLETGWILAVHPRWLNIGISTVSATMIGIIITSIYTTWRSKRLQTNYI
jgi:hypothetical protein